MTSSNNKTLILSLSPKLHRKNWVRDKSNLVCVGALMLAMLKISLDSFPLDVVYQIAGCLKRAQGRQPRISRRYKAAQEGSFSRYKAQIEETYSTIIIISS